MDRNDYYYNDILDGLSDDQSYSSSGDDDDNDNNEKIMIIDKSNNNNSNKWMKIENYMNNRSLNDDVYNNNRNNNNEQLEFENEMLNESLNHLNGLHVINNSNNDNGGKKLINNQSSSSSSKTFENIKMFKYQASSSNIITENDASTNQIESLTSTNDDEELFYDPNEDVSNEQWLESNRFSQILATNDSQIDSDLKLKKIESDAILNCPCCMTLLCIDCQQHQYYKTQYRAMFVMNCRVDPETKLLFRDKEKIRRKYSMKCKKNKKNRSKSSNEDSNTITDDADDRYNPVYCCKCNTQVAMYDSQEVYHFFSVIASH